MAPIRYVGAPCKGAEREVCDGFVTALYAGTGFHADPARSSFAHDHGPIPRPGTHARPQPGAANENQYALFDTLIDSETGEYLSEDYAFCRRWRAQGGEV